MSAVTAPADARAPWRAVAVPSEHGGWGLTLEPVLLGLLVAPSVAGGALGGAALLAFLLRTPLKLALVDRRRDRWLARSSLALRIAAVEATAVLLLAAVAWRRAGTGWLAPVALAVPLVAVELWFDVRSRSRRLLPELCGAAGMGAVAAAVAVCGGAEAPVAAGLWLVLAGRVVGAIPFVRVRILRLRRGSTATGSSDLGQAAAVTVAAVAVLVEPAMAVGAAAVTLLAVLQLVGARRPPVPAKVIGLRQMAFGLGVVLATAAGVWMS